MKLSFNPALKFVVALLPNIVTVLSSVYGHASWWPVVATAVGALMVYLVPNSPNPVKGQSSGTSGTGTNPSGS